CEIIQPYLAGICYGGANAGPVQCDTHPRVHAPSDVTKGKQSILNSLNLVHHTLDVSHKLESGPVKRILDGDPEDLNPLRLLDLLPTKEDRRKRELVQTQDLCLSNTDRETIPCAPIMYESESIVYQ